MKEVLDRAMNFVNSRFNYMDCAVLGCDIDCERNIHFYSNKPLEGYSKADGIYEKAVPFADLTGEQRQALHRYLVLGPTVRRTNLPESDKIYTKDLEAYLFAISGHPEYIFIPTGQITREIAGDENYSGMPEDSILVHELGHRITPAIRRKLAKRLGLGKRGHSIGNLSRDDFSRAVQEEMFAKHTEMLYLQENYPDIANQRLQRFEDETKQDIDTGHAHGPDTHPPASRLYFAIEKNPGLKRFVGSLYKELQKSHNSLVASI